MMMINCQRSFFNVPLRFGHAISCMRHYDHRSLRLQTTRAHTRILSRNPDVWSTTIIIVVVVAVLALACNSLVLHSMGTLNARLHITPIHQINGMQHSPSKRHSIHSKVVCSLHRWHFSLDVFFLVRSRHLSHHLSCTWFLFFPAPFIGRYFFFLSASIAKMLPIKVKLRVTEPNQYRCLPFCFHYTDLIR